MRGNANRTLADTDWMVRVLVATAVLQTWIVCVGMCGIVLLSAAAQSDTIHAALGVATAIAQACVRVALTALAGA